MRKFFTFALLIALAACASGPQESTPAATSAGSTAKAERPDVKVGDRWKFACADGRQTSERLWVVTSVDAAGIKGTENGQPLVLTPDLNPIESPRYTDSDWRALSFPLEVGNQWKARNNFVDHTNNEVHGSENISVKVVRYEKVRVGAGEFGAFKLNFKSDFNVSNGAIGINDSTYWYAPAARAVVKFNQQISWQGGSWPELTCELVEFQLQP